MHSLYIGRFQPPTHADLAALRRLAAQGAGGIVVLAGSHQAASPRQPFDWPTVAAMVASLLTPQEQACLTVLPLRDEDTDRLWRAALQRNLSQLGWWEAGARPVIETSAEIAALHDIGKLRALLQGVSSDGGTVIDDDSGDSGDLGDSGNPGVSSDLGDAGDPGKRETALRDALFSAGQPFQLPPTVAASVPVALHERLTHWMRSPACAAIAEEWHVLQRYREAWASAPYPPIFVTVDTVVRCAGHVLLVERGQHPGQGLYAVPGGFLEQTETVFDAAVRELCEETGLTLNADSVDGLLRGVAVYDRPDRSQRGRTITHAHYFDLGERALPHVAGADDARAAHWTPIAELAGHADRFLDDHYLILERFLDLPQPAPVWAPLAIFA